MEQICERVAGLDVHRDAVAVCVRTPGPRGGVHVEKARFTTTTSGLAVLAGWLAEREVALVAMEATGVIRGANVRKLDIAQVGPWRTRPRR